MTASPVAGPSERPGPPLHRPWRLVAACAEAVLVVAALVAAVWCWQHGVVRADLPLGGGRSLPSTRYAGNWVTAAVGAATLAGLLLLDALRQLALGRPAPDIPVV